MRRVPVKFRGCDFDGRTHCGDLVHGRTMGQTYIQILEQADLFDEGEASATRYRVIPESVRQLIGFDCNGDEVYEGDMVCEAVQYSLGDKPLHINWRAASSLCGYLFYVEDGESHYSKLEENYYSKFYRIDEYDEIRDRDGTKIKIEVRHEEVGGVKEKYWVLSVTPLEEVKTRCPQVIHLRPFHYTVKVGVPKQNEIDMLVAELENEYKKLRDENEAEDTQKLLHTAATVIVNLSERLNLYSRKIEKLEGGSKNE